MRIAVGAAVAALAAGSLADCTAQGAQSGRRAAGPAKTAPPSTSTPARPASPLASPTVSSPSAPATNSSPPAAKPTDKPPARPVIASGSSGDRVRELQARLRQLGLFGRNPTGYYGTVTTSAVRTFQSEHGLPGSGQVTTATWTSLRALTRAPSHSAMYPPTTNPVAKLDPRCLTGHVLCISKTSRTLSWVIDGKVRSAMDVRFGSQYTPTREGTFSVNFKSRDHVSTIYHTAMPYAMFFSGGQAVHYSSDFAARDYAGASHGCVNVRDRGKIAALFDQVRIGNKVVIYW